MKNLTLSVHCSAIAWALRTFAAQVRLERSTKEADEISCLLDDTATEIDRRALARDQRGVTAIEWALIAAVVAIVAASAVPDIAAGVAAQFETQTDQFNSPPPCTPSPAWSDPGRGAALVC